MQVKDLSRFSLYWCDFKSAANKLLLFGFGFTATGHEWCLKVGLIIAAVTLPWHSRCSDSPNQHSFSQWQSRVKEKLVDQS